MLAATVLASCAPRSVEDPKLTRSYCYDDKLEKCEELVNRCEQGEYEACESGFNTLKHKEYFKAAIRVAWYWCATADLDLELHLEQQSHSDKQVLIERTQKACRSLAIMFDLGLGTPRDPVAARRLHEAICRFPDGGDGADFADSCQAAATLSFELDGPQGADKVRELLTLGYNDSPWLVVDIAANLYERLGDVEAQLRVLRETCRGGRDRSCEGLEKLGALTRADQLAHDEQARINAERAKARAEADAERRREEREERAETERYRQEAAERAEQRKIDDQRVYADALAQAQENNRRVQEPLEKMKRDIGAIQDRANRLDADKRDQARERQRRAQADEDERRRRADAEAERRREEAQAERRREQEARRVEEERRREREAEQARKREQARDVASNASRFDAVVARAVPMLEDHARFLRYVDEQGGDKAIVAACDRAYSWNARSITPTEKQREVAPTWREAARAWEDASKYRLSLPWDIQKRCPFDATPVDTFYITKCPSPFRTTAESLEADLRTLRAMQRTLACLGSGS